MQRVTQKTSQIFTIIVLLVASVFFTLLFAFISFSERSSIKNINDIAPLLSWVLIGVLIGAFLHAGLYALLQQLKVNQSKVKNSLPEAQTFFSRIARKVAVFDVYSGVLGSVIAIILIVIFLYRIFNLNQLARTSITGSNSSFYVYLVGILLYWTVIRKFILPVLKKRFAKFGGKGISVVLTPDKKGVVINLHITYIGKDKPYNDDMVYLFEEIDMIQELSFREAENVEASLGPDISLKKKEIQNMYEYAKGEKAREDIIIQYGSGRNLLLKGKNIFLLIGVDNETNSTEIISSFKDFKKV